MYVCNVLCKKKCKQIFSFQSILNYFFSYLMLKFYQIFLASWIRHNTDTVSADSVQQVFCTLAQVCRDTRKSIIWL